MNDEALDNPVWAALNSQHAHFAVRDGSAAVRYPPEMAPFVAVESAGPGVVPCLERLVKPGESVYLVGVAPDLGDGWKVNFAEFMPQMICRSPLPLCPGPAITVLSEAHREDMLALMTLVYPGFFRPRTPEMGRYLGIYVDGALVAMAGERMHLTGYREISAVVTHPQFLGRGFAQRLTAQVTNDNLERGATPFLHTNHDNVRAISLYERLGFEHRPKIKLCSVTRKAVAG